MSLFLRVGAVRSVGNLFAASQTAFAASQTAFAALQTAFAALQKASAMVSVCNGRKSRF